MWLELFVEFLFNFERFQKICTDIKKTLVQVRPGQDRQRHISEVINYLINKRERTVKKNKCTHHKSS